jgi:multiple sugar transport system ATP-binding protein
LVGVTLKNVSKHYGNVKAVDNVSLEIKDKEFITFLGPSGCGKTTTLRMIAGLETATDGDIFIGDRLVNDLPPRDRDVAMVFQSYALYPHKSVYDNMAFPLRIRKMSSVDIEKKVTDAAELLGLSKLLKRRPKELSGGERQRVALGQAIVRNPQVFLMDELGLLRRTGKIPKNKGPAGSRRLATPKSSLLCWSSSFVWRSSFQ